MPSERDLAVIYSISRVTIRKVLAHLIELGELVRMPGKGVLVPSDAFRLGEAASSGQSNIAADEKKLNLAAIWAAVADYNITQRLLGIKKYADQAGLTFRNYLFENHEQALDAFERVEDYGLDGILIFPYNDPRYISILSNVLSRKFPVVAFRPLNGLPLCSVEADTQVGIYQAVHYLIQKYKRPVHYIGEAAETDDAPDRYLAYRSAMEDSGLGEKVDTHTWRMDTGSVDSTYWPNDKKWLLGFHAARRLLARVRPPMSVLTNNDYTAMGVYKAAAEKGLKVGKDVFVIGVDDLPLAEALDPPMTTVRTPKEEIGFEAARLLHQLITKKIKPPVHERLPYELIFRGSA